MICHTGGCHCGRIRFEVLAPAQLQVAECNCSICAKSGYLHLHLLVSSADFKLLSGPGQLSLYQFNTGTARHLFCGVCGVKSFYVPRTNPDGYSVNVRCLDAGTFTSVSIKPCDGQHWEQQSAQAQG